MFKESIQPIQDYLLGEVQPIPEIRNIQLVIMRETTDYVILRTESTRELNTAITPTSIEDNTPMERVVFLGSKQKAVENRQAGKIVRDLHHDHKDMLNAILMPKELGFTSKDDWECFLKDNLCIRCPRCALFGAVSTSKSLPKNFPVKNFTSRILYSSAFSIQERYDIEEIHTFNAVDDLTKSTKQALGERISVIPGALFPSITTLRSVTALELKLALQAIIKSSRYGAETRILGGVKNTVVGIIAAQKEVISPLELTLELAKDPTKIDDKTIHDVLQAYAEPYGEDAILLDYATTKKVIEAAEQPFTPEELEDLFTQPINLLKQIKDNK